MRKHVTGIVCMHDLLVRLYVHAHVDVCMYVYDYTHGVEALCVYVCECMRGIMLSCTSSHAPGMIFACVSTV